ncbi:MAG: VWA domain-containing protein [Acutalibacteraceae bacterium]
MNKKTKKIISLFLVFVLMFSTASVSFAAYNADGSVSVNLLCDKKEYKRGEKITVTVKTKNSSEKEKELSLSYLSTPFFQLSKHSDSLTLNAKEEKDLTVNATARHMVLASSKYQNLVDGLMGYLWSALYMIMAIFKSDYEALSVTVDGLPAVMLAHIETQGEETEEPAESTEYTVSFDLNYQGATNNIKDQKIESGSFAYRPEDPERSGYQFIGWYLNRVGSNDIFDFEEAINSDIKLYARWFNEEDTTDSDNDGVIDSIEIQFGSDPMKSDTDDDGISDYNELNWLNTDPSINDYNNDGISDGEEDADNDGLTNAYETTIGTNPAYYDSDYDYLSDYDEINIYHTNPLISDTDGDGVIDGIEVQNGYDPLVSEKVFETKASYGEINEENPVSASAVVKTDNNGAGTLTIREVSNSENTFLSNQIPGRLGAAFDFSTNGEFISAQISFNYDQSIGMIGDDFQPRIYYVNEETGEFEELENQTVNNGIVTATVEHFSTYILLNKVEFDKVWDTDIKSPNEEGTGFKDLLISFVIDSSGSMGWNDPSGLRKELTKNFIDKMADEDRASVVDFDSYAQTNSDFTNDKETLKIAVDWIDSSGGTSMYRGLSKSLGLFKNLDSISDDSLKTIFLLTDGSDDGSGGYFSDSQYMELIDECVENGIQVYTIGLGSGANAQLLERIATRGNGKYYFAERDLDLISGFDTLRQETIDYITDSNNDGICDYYTNLINCGKLLPSNGTYDFVGVTDMYGEDEDDWDGDGLLNGEEIQIATSSNGNTYIHIKSNPLISDSDGDNINDYTEVKKYNTNPLKYTKYGKSCINTLVDDTAYVYVEQVNRKSMMNSIAGFFDWQKTNESKETYINYFYDYASESNINKTAFEREQLEKREKAWEIVETVVDFVKIGKDLLDLGTDLSSYDSAVKAQVTKYNNLHKTTLDLYNKKEYDAVMKTVSGLDDFKDDLSIVNDVCGILSKTDVAEKISATVSVVTTTTSMISALGKVRLNLGNKINTFSRKYQTWLGKRPTGDVSIGTVISVATDAVGMVTDVADLVNLYGKLQANSEAFNEYIELIEYVSNNAYEDYTRVAAGDIAKIVLDKSNSEYYKQLSKAATETTSKAFINMAITIVGDFCPYVKVADLVVDVVKVGLSLTGATDYAKSLVKSQAIYALSCGCNHYLRGLYEESDIWYSYDMNNIETFTLYLTQLAQSRIVGEDSICTAIKKFNLSNWVSNLITHSSKEEIENNFKTIIGYIYTCAEHLNLQLSKKLPRYPSDYNPAWTL